MYHNYFGFSHGNCKPQNREENNCNSYNSHGKTKIIVILTIPMGKHMIIVRFTIPMEKNQQPEFPFDQGFLTHSCSKYGYIHKYLYDLQIDWMNNYDPWKLKGS